MAERAVHGSSVVVAARDVRDDLLAARDDHEPVQVEERKARAAQIDDVEPRVAQRRIEQATAEVAAVPDVPVEGRHRAGGHRDDETAPGREERPDVAKHRRRVVEVLEDLGADGVRRPAVVLRQAIRADG